MAHADMHVAKRIKSDAAHDGGPSAASQLADLSQQLLAIVSASRQADCGAAEDALQTSRAPDILREIVDLQRTALAADAGDSVHQRRQSVVDAMLEQLRDSATRLADCIQRNSVPEVPAFCKVPPSAEAARRIVTYAHKLSYTTFAPAGFEPGKTPLGNFRPPAPQEWQMRVSQLHQFAAEHERRQAMERGMQPAAEQAAPADGAAALPAAPGTAPATATAIPPMPAGWKPGDPLPGMPAMPPGWKPGDPIPLPVATATTQTAAATSQPAAPLPPQQEAGSLQKPAPPRPVLQRPVFDADFLMLGVDNEAVEEDFSSSEEESEE